MVLLASNFDQSRFLKAADLDGEKKFRIKAVTEEEVGGDKKEKKLVVWFTNDERGLVLNKTNNRTLRGAFGDDCSGWTGQDHRRVPDDGRLPRQDGAGSAGAYPAAEAGHCRKRPGDGTVGKAEADDGALETLVESGARAAGEAGCKAESSTTISTTKSRFDRA